MKRKISFPVILGLIILLIPILANAGIVQTGKCGDNATWTLDDQGLLTISGTGEIYLENQDNPWGDVTASIKKVVIQDGITGIGRMSFMNCSNLKSISIPESVTKIGSDSFRGCSSLEGFVFPSGITSVEWGTFVSCSSLTEITIPDGVTKINNHAFAECRSLEKITIPEGVISIGQSVFQSCEKLKSITIPKTVTSIGMYAFNGCSSLTDIVIPDGITSIELQTFGSCSSLSTITIPDSVKTIGNGAFVLCTSLTKVIIPNGVISIGDQAFLGCSSLIDFVIPDGVTGIGLETFASCKGLLNITIPNSVKTIGNGAFMLCTSLTEVTIPDGVTSIGDEAFLGCSNLTSATIPDSVTSMGKDVFSGCDKLNGDNDPETNDNNQEGNKEKETSEDLNGDDDSETKENNGNNQGTDNQQNTIIPSGQDIPENPINENVPEESTTINDVAINDSNFPDTGFRTYVTQFDTDGNGILSADEIRQVTSITVNWNNGSSMFGMISIDLKGVEYFSELRELECTSVAPINTLDLSKNMKLVRLTACSAPHITGTMGGARKIILGRKPALKTLICNHLDIYDRTIDLGGCYALEHFECADTRVYSLDLRFNKNLKYLDCSGSDQLKNLDITGCTELETFLCYGCQLDSINLGNKPVLTTLHCQTNKFKLLDLSGCQKLVPFVEKDERINSMKIIDGYLGNLAGKTGSCDSFTGSDLIIDTDVTVIAGNSISRPLGERNTDTEILDSGTCAEGRISWTLSNDYTLTISGTGTIPYGEGPWNDTSSEKKYREKITSVIIRAGFTKIADDCFSGMSSLKTVSLPEGLTEIGWHVFASCPSLSSITIPASVSTIHPEFCRGATSLESFIVNEGNSQYRTEDGVLIGKQGTDLMIVAYPSGKKDESYTNPDRVIEIGNYAFADNPYLKSITFTEVFSTIRQKAFSNCSGLTEITLPKDMTWLCHEALAESNIKVITIYEKMRDIGRDAIPEGTTVRCVEGSYADQWAQEHGCIPEYISAAIYLVRGSDGILRSYQNNEFVQYTGFVPMGQEVYYIVDGVQQKDLSGFAEIDGEWYLFAAGAIDSPKTNCTCYNSVSGEWWSGQLYSRADNREILMLARNGKFCSDYTGFCSNMLNNAPSYFVRNGVVDFSYTGLWFQKPTSSISTNNVTMGYFFQNGLFSTSYSYSGLFNDPEYGWWLVQYSMVNLSYTGLWNDPVYGWWLIRNGAVDFSYTGNWNDTAYGLGTVSIVNGQVVGFSGLRQDDATGIWQLFSNGEPDVNYNGLYCDANLGWWLIQNGMINFDYTGLYCDANAGWWLIDHGTIAWNYTGLWNDPIYGWWLIGNGQVCFDYVGLWNDPNCGWWLINGGQICFDYTGLWNDPVCGWWLIDHGSLATYYTGLWNDPVYGWWLIEHGSLASYYTGLWNDPNYGWWLISGGTIAWDYNGLWDDPVCGTWMIQNGTIDWNYAGG